MKQVQWFIFPLRRWVLHPYSYNHIITIYIAINCSEKEGNKVLPWANNCKHKIAFTLLLNPCGEGKSAVQGQSAHHILLVLPWEQEAEQSHLYSQSHRCIFAIAIKCHFTFEAHTSVVIKPKKGLLWSYFEQVCPSSILHPPLRKERLSCDWMQVLSRAFISTEKCRHIQNESGCYNTKSTF